MPVPLGNRTGSHLLGHVFPGAAGGVLRACGARGHAWGLTPSRMGTGLVLLVLFPLPAKCQRPSGFRFFLVLVRALQGWTPGP